MQDLLERYNMLRLLVEVANDKQVIGIVAVLH
jgi:hypothetical protein